jgi:hypothetical protein
LNGTCHNFKDSDPLNGTCHNFKDSDPLNGPLERVAVTPHGALTLSSVNITSTLQIGTMRTSARPCPGSVPTSRPAPRTPSRTPADECRQHATANEQRRHHGERAGRRTSLIRGGTGFCCRFNRALPHSREDRDPDRIGHRIPTASASATSECGGLAHRRARPQLATCGPSCVPALDAPVLTGPSSASASLVSRS